jgi:hypothetical protein
MTRLGMTGEGQGLRVASIVWLLTLLAQAAPQSGRVSRPPAAHFTEIFKASDTCLACHNGLSTSAGEDISIGFDWRASMMANSSRDPYWQAGVRREIVDHPAAAAEIEHECSICHMPMAHLQARAKGRMGRIFAHLPVGRRDDLESRLAADGVSCTVCHQISDQKLGTPESFTGHFVMDLSRTTEPRAIYGPFQIDAGRTTVMRSATGFKPTEAAHVRTSELCGTCHTLLTQALGSGGEVIGRLPEQVPYLEWRHSAYRDRQSCQACHMPVVGEETRMASVLGELRAGVARHVFRGGNFFMLRLLNRYRDELGVAALPQELDLAARRTVEFLRSDTAAVSIVGAEISGSRLEVDLSVENRAGHKLPTGYPSRRVWLHLTVRDRAGRPVFESGAATASGLIQGNDSDANPDRFEPHYAEISRPDEVQIYESIMGDPAGAPTTGLLTAVRFLKDNRLLPEGFDKATAEPDVAVVGEAARDDDFTAGCDRVRYLVDVGGREGPFRIDVALRYQPIAYRWAQNLRRYDALETRRFVRYYDAMAAGSVETLARATAVSR